MDLEVDDRILVGRDFPPIQTGPGAHPASCTMGTGSFPGVKFGRGVLLTTHPLLVPWSWKSRAIPLPTLWATTGPVTGTFRSLWKCLMKYCAASGSSKGLLLCSKLLVAVLVDMRNVAVHSAFH